MLAGTLDTFSVGEILSLVGRAGTSGALRVWNEGESATVYCRNGEVTFASVNADAELGDVLVRAGFVPPSEWTEVASDEQPAKRLAEVLDRTGIDAPRVHRYIAHHTEECVFELDAWRTGELRFDSELDHSLGAFFRYPTAALLAAVDQRRAAWDALVAKLGSVERVVDQAPVIPGEDDEMSISKAQLAVLRHIDGQRTVRELARFLGAGLFQTSQVVAGLVDGGLAMLLDAPVRPAPVVAPSPATIDAHGEIRPAHAAVSLAGETNGHPTNGHGTNGHGAGANGHDAVTPDALPDDQPTLSNGAMEFVEPGDGPARDLILRLLSAVKEEL